MYRLCVYVLDPHAVSHFCSDFFFYIFHVFFYFIIIVIIIISLYPVLYDIVRMLPASVANNFILLEKIP